MASTSTRAEDAVETLETSNEAGLGGGEVRVILSTKYSE
jgi:hypothetical protein